jgi:hypothetical protein
MRSLYFNLYYMERYQTVHRTVCLPTHARVCQLVMHLDCRRVLQAIIWSSKLLGAACISHPALKKFQRFTAAGRKCSNVLQLNLLMREKVEKENEQQCFRLHI